VLSFPSSFSLACCTRKTRSAPILGSRADGKLCLKIVSTLTDKTLGPALPCIPYICFVFPASLCTARFPEYVVLALSPRFPHPRPESTASCVSEHQDHAPKCAVSDEQCKKGCSWSLKKVFLFFQKSRGVSKSLDLIEN